MRGCNEVDIAAIFAELRSHNTNLLPASCVLVFLSSLSRALVLRRRFVYALGLTYMEASNLKYLESSQARRHLLEFSFFVYLALVFLGLMFGALLASSFSIIVVTIAKI